MSLILAEDLTKVYHVRGKPQPNQGVWKGIRIFSRRPKQTILAVNHISFQIEQGEMVGFLGPNGAGKSTVVKIMSGVLVPTSGKVEVNGLIPHQNRIDHAMNIGVVFGQRTTLWWDLPLRDSFELLRVIYEIGQEDYRKSLDWLADMLELGDLLDRPVRQLSLGQRMRAELAAALLHRPAVLFLDEPTIGLDVAIKQRIRNSLRELNHKWGVTLLLTTHDIRDIEEVCGNLIVIDKGQLVYDGSLASFRDTYCDKRVIRVALKDEPTAGELTQDTLPNVIQAERNGPWVTLYYRQSKTTAANIAGYVMAHYPVTDLAVEEPSIENTVADLYRGKLL